MSSCSGPIVRPFAGLILLLSVALSGCVMATVRTLDEDKEANAGFNPDRYVEDIWESQVLPTYREQAQDFATLYAALQTDQDATIAAYGHRSGTGAYSFMVRGTGTLLTFDTSSRAGVAAVDLDPPDGTADLSLTIGPLIKVSQRASVRDAVGFISYGDFVNQQEFAGIANAMGERITAMLAEKLGATDVEAIGTLDPAQVEGKVISFIGAFSVDDIASPIVVPVEIEVGE